MRKNPYNYIVPRVSTTVDYERVPNACAECVTHCQEGHIDFPCNGNFDCEYLESEGK